LLIVPCFDLLIATENILFIQLGDTLNKLLSVL
jgi:hypothetical protein